MYRLGATVGMLVGLAACGGQTPLAVGTVGGAGASAAEGSSERCEATPCAVTDVDGDGHAASACGGDDCNDNDRRVYPGASAPQFLPEEIQALDTARGAGAVPSVAVDGSGAIHVSSVRWAASTCVGVLHYDTNRGGDWSHEDIDGNADWGFGAITADAAGHAYIAYQRGCAEPEYSSAILFATNASGRWVTEIVDSNWEASVGWYADIAVDSVGAAHMVYTYSDFHELDYATNRSGHWVTTKLPTGGTPYACSIAVDASCTSHISYFDGTSLRYMSNATGAWVVETPDPAPAYSTSIAVDGRGDVHIAYEADVNSETTELRYATRTGGAWNTEVVAPNGQSCRLALDRDANPHIVWTRNMEGAGVGYAERTASGWRLDVVDSLLSVGSNADLAVDASGFSYVAVDANDVLALTAWAPASAVDWACAR